MNKRGISSRTAWSFALPSVVGLVALVPLQAIDGDEFPKPVFNEKGELVRPDLSYRQWVYVGTPLTPNELNPPEAPFPDFHNVYIHPADFDHYKRTGLFQDGTVMIKELVTVGSKVAVSGNGYFMGEFIGLEATIKDSVRFKDEPGHWAYFTFGHSYPLADAAQAAPVPACNACHEASGADDFVFTQYYPVLRAARGSGSGRSMTSDSGEFKQIMEAMMAAKGPAFEPTATTPIVKSAVPVSSGDLFKYLQGADYRKWPAAESGTHPSRGPHTKRGLPVRVYLDPKLDASLAAGNRSHPAGSAAVKEMFDENGNLQGWAVMVKTAEDSASGQGWFWYEITSTTNGSDPVASGNGVPLCFGCHFPGKDFVLTDYPLQ